MHKKRPGDEFDPIRIGIGLFGMFYGMARDRAAEQDKVKRAERERKAATELKAK